ncbi:MAG: YggS family pyridoxal phosphate-dependent enzyme [Pelagibacteraceae bacterium]|nr:MAG: YggS family pyridoxal phosphate-dependent enzyme [Pelagibacteraceae bacterium]
MHITVQNLINIENKIKLKSEVYKTIKVIAVSKTFAIDKIKPLIDHGHTDFGENKVQEALDKWTEIKISNSKIQLHLIGKLQTNKVKFAVKLFDFIHSVDNEKLAKKISEEQTKQTKKVKIFIQVNIGDEPQKSGISKSELQNFYFYCKNLNLNVVGLMCIPPAEKNSNIYFSEMNLLNKKLNLSELSMGMSADYLEAINNQATYVRIGSDIFGRRD